MVLSFLSPDWYRVADLRLHVPHRVSLQRQVFRGEPWTVIHDRISGQFHRLPPQAAYLMGRMDGQRSVQDLWEEACAHFPASPPSQAEVIRLISQLHQANLVAGDRAPDLAELSRRARSIRLRRRLARLRNPLAMQIPLLDPEPLLGRAEPWLRFVFTRGFAAGWGLFMLLALGLIVANWAALTDNVIDRVLNGSNLLLMLVAYPVVKALHEFGHGIATRHWGGEVRETGVMVLLFMPLPYVDASAAAAFPSKWQRIAVGAAGILVEMTLAALAALVWLAAEAGMLRAFAYDVMMLGGVSTLLVNGNPLLRFDGYFILSDLIEIPNLGQRSNAYVWYLADRYILGNPQAESLHAAGAERVWLVGYAVLAFLYRMMVLAAVTVFIAGRFPVVGVLLALIGLVPALGWPILRGLHHLLTGPGLATRRLRAVSVALGTAAALGLLIFAIPFPRNAVVPGVVAAGPETQLRAQTEGFVAEILTDPGQSVAKGAPILRMEDPDLLARLAVARADLDQATMEYHAALVLDRLGAAMAEQKVSYAEEEVRRLQEKADSLVVVAPIAGGLVLPEASDLPGRLLHKGESFGYVWPGSAEDIRIAVDQTTGEALTRHAGPVEMRLVRNPAEVIPAHLTRTVPEATMEVPSGGLSTRGGGSIVLDPTDPDRNRALERIFIFVLAPDIPMEDVMIGERLVLRLDLGWEPLGDRFLRALRQVFLRQIGQ